MSLSTTRPFALTDPPLRPALLNSPPSGIREVSNAASARPEAIRLDLGQPSFATPDHVIAAAVAAIEAGQTGYTHTRGTVAVREAVAEKLARVNGITAGIDDIACTPGGAAAVAAALTAVLAPGDEVLLPDPAWPAFATIAAWLDAVAVPYTCAADRGFQPDLDQIEHSIGPRTRAIVINSPNNPTGAVYPSGVLDGLADLALRHNLWLVSDECYDEICFTPRAPSVTTRVPPERSIAVFSCSKTYAMTGWRLGYLVARGEALATIEKILESNVACASAISQAAATAALSGPQEPVAAMVQAYRERRDLAVELLRRGNAGMAAPDGAFYVMADISRSGRDARTFALALLAQESVAVAPGTAFGAAAPDAVRFSLANSSASITEGIARFCRFLDAQEASR